MSGTSTGTVCSALHSAVQTSQHPPASISTNLTVYGEWGTVDCTVLHRPAEAWAEIVGSEEKVFRTGSDIQLVCRVRDITQPPAYVFWYATKSTFLNCQYSVTFDVSNRS